MKVNHAAEEEEELGAWVAGRYQNGGEAVGGNAAAAMREAGEVPDQGRGEEGGRDSGAEDAPVGDGENSGGGEAGRGDARAKTAPAGDAASARGREEGRGDAGADLREAEEMSGAGGDKTGEGDSGAEGPPAGGDAEPRGVEEGERNAGGEALPAGGGPAEKGGQAGREEARREFGSLEPRTIFRVPEPDEGETQRRRLVLRVGLPKSGTGNLGRAEAGPQSPEPDQPHRFQVAGRGGGHGSGSDGKRNPGRGRRSAAVGVEVVRDSRADAGEARHAEEIRGRVEKVKIPKGCCRSPRAVTINKIVIEHSRIPRETEVFAKQLNLFFAAWHGAPNFPAEELSSGAFTRANEGPSNPHKPCTESFADGKRSFRDYFHTFSVHLEPSQYSL